MVAMQFLIAIDQLLNTLLGGWADETVSARSYRMADKKSRWAVARWLIDTIFFLEDNHCKQAYLNELSRNGFPAEYREAPVERMLDKPLHNPLPELLCKLADKVVPKSLKDCFVKQKTNKEPTNAAPR